MARRYVIVGNGPAGVSAAETIRRHDEAGEIRIIGGEGVGFYSRPGLAYLLTGAIPEERLFSRPRIGLRACARPADRGDGAGDRSPAPPDRDRGR